MNASVDNSTLGPGEIAHEALLLINVDIVYDDRFFVRHTAWRRRWRFDRERRQAQRMDPAIRNHARITQPGGNLAQFPSYATDHQPSHPTPSVHRLHSDDRFQKPPVVSDDLHRHHCTTQS